MSESLPPFPKSFAEIKAHTFDLTEGIDATNPAGESMSIAGFFADEHSTLAAATAARAAGHTAIQVWSPYPVHGIDAVLGLQRSLIGRPVFAICLVGFLFTFFGIHHLMVEDWTVIYGGKPYSTWALWVVPTLEAGLLFGAVLNLKMVLFTCRLIPDPFVRLPDPRVTDDQFCVSLSTARTPASELEALLIAHGAVTTRQISAEVASGLPVFQPLVDDSVVLKETAHA